MHQKCLLLSSLLLKTQLFFLGFYFFLGGRGGGLGWWMVFRRIDYSPISSKDLITDSMTEQTVCLN